MKQTKIVASVSDRRCDVDFIRQLFNAGIQCGCKCHKNEHCPCF